MAFSDRASLSKLLTLSNLSDLELPRDQWERTVKHMPTAGLSAQRLCCLHVDGLEGLIDAQHDGQADGGFGRRQHDHKDGEHLAVVAAGAVARERQVVDVRRVQDQLDAHQNADGIAPRQHAVQPEHEDDQADDQVVGQPDAHSSVSSFRDNTTAPISAANNTTDASSKGRRYSPRKLLPIPYVVGAGVPAAIVCQRALNTAFAITPKTSPMTTSDGRRPTERLEMRTSAMRCVSITANSKSTRMPPT